MKKFKNIFALLVIALVGLSLTACSDDDNLNTNQYGGDITLTAFGPCPVLRGGTLYLQGKNLDQIVEIDLPGSDPITAIEVLEKGTHSRIAIQVPAEGGEVGPITLKTAKGGTIVSTSSITFREDIRIDDVFIESEGNLTGSVGDVVTIKGDYLNLINAVIFTDKDTVEVDEFVSQDRYTIQVPINKFAQSGTLILTDLAETPTEIETEQAIVVNLPEAAVISPATVKAGQTVTITGVGMDQIESVVLQGVIVPAEDITLSDDGNSIIFTLPETAQDGEVTLVTYSGVKIAGGTIETVVPTNLSVSPNPVKNGTTITISGTDIDLVTGIVFPSDKASEIDKRTSTTISTVVPMDAPSGEITLSMANGKTVTVEFTTVKPTITTFNPTTLVAGNKLAMRGTDLDLVASIVFPGDGEPTVVADDFTASNATTIGLTVPTAAGGEGVTLVMLNGEKVQVSGVTISAATDPAVAADVSGVVGTEVTVNGKNFYNVESVYIGETKITKFKNRTDNSMTFVIPESITPGTYDFRMITPEGKEFKVCKFTVEPKELDLAKYIKNMDGTAITYPYSFTWDDTGRFSLTASDLAAMGAKAGSVLSFYKPAGVTGQVQINDSSWNQIITLADWGSGLSVFEYTLTANDVSGGLVIQGGINGITKIGLLP